MGPNRFLEDMKYLHELQDRTKAPRSEKIAFMVLVALFVVPFLGLLIWTICN